MLKLFDNNLKTLTFVTRLLIYRQKSFILPLIFANYTRIKLSHLFDMKLRLKSIPDEALQIALDAESVSTDENYVDTYSCALANADLLKDSETRWYYVGSLSSLKKYKITLRPTSKVSDNELLMSETMKFNIESHLNVSDLESDRYFIIAASDPESGIAEEAGISLIENPHDCTEGFIDDLLSRYFSSARYLRLNDILSVDIEKFSPQYRYMISGNNRRDVLFKITHLNVDKSSLNPRKGCFVVRGITALVQRQSIHGYSPRRYTISPRGSTNRDRWLKDGEISNAFVSNCPPALEDSLKSLMDCIYPFTQRDSYVDVRPVFLVKGARGSGKSSLVRIAAQRMGLNLVNVDLSEVQSLTSAQTEAKLRIVLHNARNCVPSILLLSNIQIFGKDAEGKEDQRTISSFEGELNNLSNDSSTNKTFPLVVVATGNSSSTLSASLEQVFIETISLDNLNQNERFETIKWLLKTKGLECEADLTHIAAICTDFGLADLNAIVLHATKIRISCLETADGGIRTTETTTLRREDFEKAHEYMQSRYSDWMGAPRVPKVQWEDIGGLADLKSEILRRIELPLLTSEDLGLRRSGLLLYGPPGTGKTLLAKAVATECQVHFLSVKGPELLNMYVGQSEKNVREVFARARASSPCVIFFDELDSLAPNRGRSGDSGGVMDRVVSQLLSEIDGVDNNNSGSVFIIGATNRPDLIDPALLRPGRFDKLLYVGVSSDKNSQLGILRALTRKFEFSEDGAGLEELVDKLADNLTGADIYAICSNAWLSAIRRHVKNSRSNSVDDQLKPMENYSNDKTSSVIVTKEDFIEAARNVVPSVSKDELKRYEKLKAELG